MAAFLKINSTTPVSLKEASGTDYDYVTYVILNNFASSNTGVGTVSVNPGSTAGLTSIGTFTDTYRPYAVGTHPIDGSLTTTTYTFYQDLQSASESLTRPVEFVSGSTKEQTDTNLNADTISVALANLVANGVGSYALATSSPAGGTWTSLATITNTVNPSTSNVTYLWRKTAGASTPSALRPVKVNATSPVSLKEMSDAEIQSLTARLRNQIVSTGKGKYAVQTSAPVGGTWVTQGTAFSDTRNQSTNETYSGTYTGNYSGTYAGNYTGTYVLYYAGYIGGYFSGTYTGYYTGTYTGNYTGGYTGATANAATETVSTVSLWLRTA